MPATFTRSSELQAGIDYPFAAFEIPKARAKIYENGVMIEGIRENEVIYVPLVSIDSTFNRSHCEYLQLRKGYRFLGLGNMHLLSERKRRELERGFGSSSLLGNETFEPESSSANGRLPKKVKGKQGARAPVTEALSDEPIREAASGA